MSKKLRKPLSIILSIMMVLSVFTIIPLTANAADVCPYCGSADIEWDDYFWSCNYCCGAFEPPAQSGGGHSGITVTCDPEDGGYVDIQDYGDDLWNLIAYPSSGYVFVRFVQGGNNFYGNDSLLNESNGEVTAIFALAYTVTWYNYDGTVLETDENVEEDSLPSYDGAVPTKPEDDENTYEFAGWTPEITAVSANAEYTATFTAVPKQAAPGYVKVTEDQQDWSGDYLIVYEDEDENKAFNGSSDYLNSKGNTINVTISGGKIASDATTDAAKVTITQIDGGYSIVTANGTYIGGVSGSNAIATQSDAILNTISLEDGYAVIVSNGTYLRFNPTWPGFRYYRSKSQKPVQLYKLTGGSTPTTYTVTWKNWDGTELEKDTDVAEGAMPEYNGATPEKAEDDENTYTFAGWTDGTTTYALTDTLPIVSGDVTYTATFTATPKPDPDQLAADAVAAMMNALPDPQNVTVNDKDAIAAAGYAYAALTNAQKALIDNAVVVRYRAVAEAYAAVAKEEADQEAANGVTYLINQIPDEITANDKEAIENARRAYNMLTDDQKALVDAETLAKLEAAEEAFAALLINDSYVENESVAPGKSIKIVGAAQGGTAPYTFAYYFKKTVNTKWNKLGTEFGTATSAKFTPTSAGAYDIKVIVKDADGKTEEKLLTAEAVGELTLDTGAAVSASTIMYGESFTITAAPTGGTAPYTCKFYYKKSFNSTWHALKAKDNSAVLTPTGVGDYDLKCVVTDAEGVVAQKVFQVFVDGVLPLENVSEINKDETVPVGSTITISGKAKGGKSPVTYEYFFKRSENSKWNSLKPATDAGTYAKFTLTKAASYDFKVIATDSEGTKAEKIITVTAAADT